MFWESRRGAFGPGGDVREEDGAGEVEKMGKVRRFHGCRLFLSWKHKILVFQDELEGEKNQGGESYSEDLRVPNAVEDGLFVVKHGMRVVTAPAPPRNVQRIM